MKVRNLTLGMLLIFAVAFSSCKKDNDSGDPGNGGGSGTLTLKYDGTSWDASLAVVGINTNGVVNVTGSDSQAHQASVILYGATGPGTYEVTMGMNNQLRWTEGLGQEDTYVANGILGTGTIIVTELTDSNVVGTFSFTGYNTSGDTKQITDGQFNATF